MQDKLAFRAIPDTGFGDLVDGTTLDIRFAAWRAIM
jgi:hypothetical protein